MEDTLLGFYLTPWKGAKRKAIQSARFYLFDLGVTWFLSQVSSLPEKSDLFGKAFESFIVSEVRAICSYKRLRKNLYFWRTTHKDEVDLIIESDFAIEIKSSQKVTGKHCRGLVKIKDEGFSGRLVLVSRDPIKRTIGDVELWPFDDFLDQLWKTL
ncbi:MAG: DUF4143 domain-containing protein [Proteobacteria bacterium]|nr:DUF4143 domain-containing protein [Pseudomonadota bacterium]